MELFCSKKRIIVAFGAIYTVWLCYYSTNTSAIFNHIEQNNWLKSAWGLTKTSRCWIWHGKITCKHLWLNLLESVFCLSGRALWNAVKWDIRILDIFRLTTPWEEEKVSWEEAAGTPKQSAIQEVDHVTHSMARGKENPELQPCPNIYDIFVRYRARKPRQRAQSYT